VNEKRISFMRLNELAEFLFFAKAETPFMFGHCRQKIAVKNYHIDKCGVNE
jgi:hypothetical protein